MNKCYNWFQMIIDKTRQLFHLLRGRRIRFDLNPYQRTLRQIDARESVLAGQTDAQLKEQSQRQIQQARTGGSLKTLLVDTFALGREMSRRSLGLRHYDVQLLAGLALHQGNMVEMQTGEGKTLAVVLPAILNALTGRGVHILTFNDYLARRDAEWMGPVYKAFGLTVGFIQEGMCISERQQAYACDITYGTAREIGFDYLRDHLCRNTADLVQRPHHVVFVDEADSILIDEARIPLVIAGSVDSEVMNLYDAVTVARSLKPETDYDIDEHARNTFLTDKGITTAEALLKCGPLHNPENFERLARLNLALHAEHLLQCDKDYIVRDNKIELVDEFTGRVALNRQWPHGLQTALEAKEGLDTQPQGMIRNSIILVHFLQHYQKTAGMTATALPTAEEFYDFYKLKTVVIPPHKPCIRTDLPDQIFAKTQVKAQALVEHIRDMHATGRPILVGTGSVRESEDLATRLHNAGIVCQVLNAKNNEQEAKVVAQAGSLNAVTISTNMAGRGTDIKLGGGRAHEYETVRALGGLHVIGTHRFESRRIDNQLRGRSGRQGDPGSSQFFVSLEDELIQRYGLATCLSKFCQEQAHEQPLTHRRVSRDIAHVQRIIEGQNFQIRKTLWKYSYLLEQQREIIYKKRNDLLKQKKTLHLLETHHPQRFAQLRSTVPTDIIEQCEREVALYHTDRAWSYYLAEAEHLRMFIHVRSLDGCDPLGEFHQAIAQTFREMQTRLNDSILNTLSTVNITPNGINFEEAGLKTPTSTWTYVINDNPLGNWTQRLRNSIKRKVKEKLFR
ncbi:accessory Sec system translocase SecA2 [Planctomycetota bacterium]